MEDDRQLRLETENAKLKGEMIDSLLGVERDLAIKENKYHETNQLLDEYREKCAHLVEERAKHLHELSEQKLSRMNAEQKVAQLLGEANRLKSELKETNSILERERTDFRLKMEELKNQHWEALRQLREHGDDSRRLIQHIEDEVRQKERELEHRASIIEEMRVRLDEHNNLLLELGRSKREIGDLLTRYHNLEMILIGINNRLLFRFQRRLYIKSKRIFRQYPILVWLLMRSLIDRTL